MNATTNTRDAAALRRAYREQCREEIAAGKWTRERVWSEAGDSAARAGGIYGPMAEERTELCEYAAALFAWCVAYDNESRVPKC